MRLVGADPDGTAPGTAHNDGGQTASQTDGAGNTTNYGYSDLGERGGLFDQAGLQNDLEDLLGCPVHTTATGGLRQAHPNTREEIEREAVQL